MPAKPKTSASPVERSLTSSSNFFSLLTNTLLFWPRIVTIIPLALLAFYGYTMAIILKVLNVI